MQNDRHPTSGRRKGARLLFTALAIVTVGSGIAAAQRKIGYTDTPFLPGGKWHVHDGARPQPKVIDPGTTSTQDQPGRPPSDAVVLFDGKDLSKWRDDKGNPTGWKLENGALVTPPSGGSIYSRQEFGDCQLHVEFSTPNPAKGEDQDRGNSGVFLLGRYEIQVLDSYDNITYPDGQAGAIYGQYPPLVNASRKPGEWQSYDIIFTGPRFNGQELVRPAHFTVLHNGVVVHNHTAPLGPMSFRQLPKYSPHGEKGPISFQDHNHPVRYRNVWVRELKNYDED